MKIFLKVDLFYERKGPAHPGGAFPIPMIRHQILFAAAIGTVVAQTEGRALGLVALAHVAGGAAHFDGVQGAVMLPMIGAAVDGTFDALIDRIHKNSSFLGTALVCPEPEKVYARSPSKHIFSSWAGPCAILHSEIGISGFSMLTGSSGRT